MIILYHLKNSRSQRVVWLLQELGCEYHVIEQSEITPSFSFPEHVKPLKFPTVSIQHEDGVTFLSETGAICELLSDLYNNLGPIDGALADTANNLFWKNYADASLMQTMILKQIFKQIVQNTPILFRPIPWALKTAFFKMYLNGTIDLQLKRVDTHLRDHQWMCGTAFSYVDIMMWFPVRAAMVSAVAKKYEHIEHYLYVLGQRPGFKEALRIGQWDQSLFNTYWS